MQGLIINRSYLVELKMVNTPAVGQVIVFGQIPAFNRGILLTGIEVHSSTELSTCPSGASTVINAGLSSAVLNLVTESETINQSLPLYNLNPANMSGWTKKFNSLPLNVNKSNIQLLSTTNLTINQAFAITFYYSILSKR